MHLQATSKQIINLISYQKDGHWRFVREKPQPIRGDKEFIQHCYVFFPDSRLNALLWSYFHVLFCIVASLKPLQKAIVRVLGINQRYEHFFRLVIHLSNLICIQSCSGLNLCIHVALKLCPYWVFLSRFVDIILLLLPGFMSLSEQGQAKQYFESHFCEQLQSKSTC